MNYSSVIEFGALADGVSKDTSAIQSAIEQVAKTGGGTVFFPAGCYLCGTIYLDNNVYLEFAPGAVLRGSPDREDFNADDFSHQNCAEPSENASGAHLIVAIGKANVGISGGCIEGNANVWLNRPCPHYPLKFQCGEWRPGQMLFFCECSHVTIHDTVLQNAPYWTCFFYGCRNVFANNVRIWNDPRTPNGDGFDIDCCHNVSISNCQIESGDDCIAVRADGSRSQDISNVCELVTLTNCTLSSPCNAIRIGVGEGEIRQCLFSNCIVHNSRTGICIVSKYGATKGVEIHDISFMNVQLETKRPFMISSDVRGCQNEASMAIYNIHLKSIFGSGSQSCFITGNTDCNISHISLSDIELDYHGGTDIIKARQNHGSYGEFGIVTADSALYLQNASEIEMDRVRIRWGKQEGPWRTALESVNVTNLNSVNCRLLPPIRQLSANDCSSASHGVGV